MADDLGPDFSGVRAHATLEIHMKECSERQAEIRAGMVAIHGRLDSLQKTWSEEIHHMESSFEKKLTAIGNRMWAAAAALIGALAMVAFYLLAKHIV